MALVEALLGLFSKALGLFIALTLFFSVVYVVFFAIVYASVTK